MDKVVSLSYYLFPGAPVLMRTLIKRYEDSDNLSIKQFTRDLEKVGEMLIGDRAYKISFYEECKQFVELVDMCGPNRITAEEIAARKVFEENTTANMLNQKPYKRKPSHVRPSFAFR